MKFAGELRIPDIDHPGIPATVVIDDTHIEIVLDGESLGRWSLYDVRARRLISKAFALDLAGEDVTFLSEEPVDFAYRGVERMAEVWAQFKTMRGPQRMIAVRRSRSGATPSRVAELRRAMEANLAAFREPRATPIVDESRSVETALPPNRRPSPIVPDATAEVAEEAMDRVEEEVTEEVAQAKPDPALDARGIRLQQERARLEQLTAEATERDARGIELFRAEIARIEDAKVEAEKLEADRQALLDAEVEKLKAEMRKVKEAEAGLTADVASTQSSTLKEQAARLEAERVRLAELAEQRLAASRSILQVFEAERTELERKEAERWQAHRKEMERLRADLADLDRNDREPTATTSKPPPPSPPSPEVVADVTEVESSEDGDVESAQEPEAAPVAEADAEEAPEVAAAVETVPLPPLVPVEAAALATPVPVEAKRAEKKGGLGKSVRSAFLREKEPHEHIFVTAPGTLGISRSICSECGFVSIGAVDD